MEKMLFFFVEFYGVMKYLFQLFITSKNSIKLFVKIYLFK